MAYDTWKSTVQAGLQYSLLCNIHILDLQTKSASPCDANDHAWPGLDSILFHFLHVLAQEACYMDVPTVTSDSLFAPSEGLPADPIWLDAEAQQAVKSYTW